MGISKCQYKEVKTKQYEYPYYIEKMVLVNNELWCTIWDGLHVYNRNCERVKEIKHPQMNKVMGLTHLVDLRSMAVACTENYGLHQLDCTGRYLSKVAEGSFSDVCYYKKQLYALDCSQAVIYIFQYIRKDKAWRELGKIKLRHSKPSYSDRIAVYSDGIYVSAYNDDCVYLYSPTSSELQSKTGEKGSGLAGKLNGPRVCDVESVGNVLVTDFANNRLQVLDARGKWQILSFLKTGNIDGPVHALMDMQTQDIWVATIDNTIHKYQRLWIDNLPEYPQCTSR